MQELYNYLLDTYKPDEPIFLKNINFKNYTKNSIRQQMKQLTDKGLIARFENGIYYIPTITIFNDKSTLGIDMIISRKYLTENSQRCGYVSGYLLINYLGLTTQVPMVFEIVTNKTKKNIRRTLIKKSRVILRKPRTKVTNENYKYLQFLDAMYIVFTYAELEDDELNEQIHYYMSKANITMEQLEPYLSYYPDKIYRNLLETKVIYHDLPTQPNRYI